jgi:hypothetical protein
MTGLNGQPCPQKLAGWAYRLRASGMLARKKWSPTPRACCASPPAILIGIVDFKESTSGIFDPSIEAAKARKLRRTAYYFGLP